ncbi:MAG: KTSC domain-containing protein [Candidatus Hodarchaeota archaeon]
MEGDIIKRPVKSSKILSIGYDVKSKKLEIAFRSGRKYQYLNVPKSEHEKLMSAKSHFTYFQQNIRDHYRWVKKR